MCIVLLLDRETEEAYGHEKFSGAVAFGGKNLNVKYCFHVSTKLKVLKLRVTPEGAAEDDVYAYESSRHDSIYTLQT